MTGGRDTIVIEEGNSKEEIRKTPTNKEIEEDRSLN
jgi:hypothetical protein